MSTGNITEDETNANRKSFKGKDVFRRTSIERDREAHSLCEFEDMLKEATTLFIIPRFQKEGESLPESGAGDSSIKSYDVFNEAGLRVFILSQCTNTSSGFTKSSKDPLLYILTNSGGNELMTVIGQFRLCFGYICGTGVKVYVGGTLLGSVSKHMHSIYIVRDDRNVKTYVLNRGHGNGNQVAVEYLYDNLVAADIACGKHRESIRPPHHTGKEQIVYSIHFDREARPCPEAKAMIIGVAVVLFHDHFRHTAVTEAQSELSIVKSQGSGGSA